MFVPNGVRNTAYGGSKITTRRVASGLPPPGATGYHRVMFAKDGEELRDGTILVGYLDDRHPFRSGSVSGDFIAELKHLASTSSIAARDYHECQLCSGPVDQRARSDRDIVLDVQGRRYQAPGMITHYIEEHNYCPPGEYIDMVLLNRQHRQGQI